MRNFLLAVLLAAIAVSGGGAGAQDSDDRYDRWVTVENNYQNLAYRIYIIPSKRDCCWSRDLLEDIVIYGPHRGRDFPNLQKINFDDGSGDCVFNIRVTTSERGWEWVFKEVDVCTLSKNAGKIVLNDVPRRRDETRWININNASRLTAVNVYAIPKDADCCWSRNLLGNDVIRKLSERKVPFADGKIMCKYDIRITSSKKDIDWNLDGVDVCNDDRRTINLTSEALDGQRRLVVVENASDFDASDVFAKPAWDNCCWSNDLLGDRVIQGRKSLLVRMRRRSIQNGKHWVVVRRKSQRRRSLIVDFDDGSGKCVYDYRVARDKGGEWTGTFGVCSQPVEAIPTLLLPDAKA
jgi:hypothetical protein